jgi:predicted RNA binding protein YcfA (HicA-like mRNA interferase family)
VKEVLDSWISDSFVTAHQRGNDLVHGKPQPATARRPRATRKSLPAFADSATLRPVSVEKTIEKLLRGESDANFRFEEICHLLQAKGFRMRTQGSHHIFTRPGVLERINLQRDGAKAKPYQIRQVRKILAIYKLL